MASLDDIWGVLKVFPKFVLWVYDKLQTLVSQVSSIYDWVNTIQGWSLGTVVASLSSISGWVDGIEAKTNSISWTDVTNIASDVTDVASDMANLVDLFVTQSTATVKTFLDSLVSSFGDAMVTSFDKAVADKIKQAMINLAQEVLEDALT